MTTADLSDELYRATLLRIVEAHAARLAGCAALLGQSVGLAPTPAAMRFTAGYLREVASLVVELSDLRRALAGTDLALPSLRREEEHEPAAPATWAEAVAGQLVTGRQARWQLHEHDLCSYAPLREWVARAVASLDARHALVESLAESAARDDAEAFGAALDRWTAWAYEAFGRPNTPGMAYALSVALRRRDSSATRKDFLDDLRALARTRGLPLAPRWQPEPERPSLVAVLSELARKP